MSLLELSQKIAKPLPVRHRTPVVYVERARIYVAANQVIIRNKIRQIRLPVGSTACLMLSPGTSISKGRA
jgi:CRISPR/Cas system-associated endonuclease Cas1